MDAAQALEDLTEISSQLVEVAILDRDGALLATTIAEPEAATRYVAGVARLLEEVDKHAKGGAPIQQLDAAMFEGSVFAVRGQGRVIAATTRPDPTVGLVLYDLRRCLESLGETPGPGPALAATGDGHPQAGLKPERPPAEAEAERPA